MSFAASGLRHWLTCLTTSL